MSCGGRKAILGRIGWCGVRQGGLSSPKLFNVSINGLIDELNGTLIGCRFFCIVSVNKLFSPNPSVRDEIGERVDPAGGHADAGVASVLAAKVRQICVRVLFLGHRHGVVPVVAT